MNNKNLTYMKTFTGRILILILFTFVIVGKTETVLASEEKISNELKEYMEEASEDKLLTIFIVFDNRIDTASIQTLTADADTYEERVEIITAIYKDTIDTFIKTYFGDDKSRISKTFYDRGFIKLRATKGEILLYAEEEKVQYMDAMESMAGMEEVTSGSVLIEAKAAAIANLLGHVELSDYRIEQQEEIKGIINDAIIEIDSLESKESICIAVMGAEEQLDAVKTEQQLILEENNKQESDLKEPIVSPPVQEEEETPQQGPQTEQSGEEPKINAPASDAFEKESVVSEPETFEEESAVTAPALQESAEVLPDLDQNDKKQLSEEDDSQGFEDENANRNEKVVLADNDNTSHSVDEEIAEDDIVERKYSVVVLIVIVSVVILYLVYYFIKKLILMDKRSSN